MGARSANAELLNGLGTLADLGVVGNLSDARLLDQFLTPDGEAAEAAFERGGPARADRVRRLPERPARSP